MKHNRIWLKWLFINIFRFIISATLLFSGWVKVIDPMGMVYKLKAYADYFDLDFSENGILLKLLVVIVAVTECHLGFSLLLGIRRKSSSILVFLLLLAMTGVTVFVYLKNPVADCGCFGEAIELTHGQTLIKNVILIVMASFLVVYPRRMRRFITERNQWITSIYSFCFVIGSLLYSFHFTPIISFTDYKVGTDVLSNYRGEVGDGELLQDVASLYIVDKSGNDLTEAIISKSGVTFLLTIPDVNSADDSSADLINELHDYAEENSYQFLALIGTSLDRAYGWRDRTGASYPIYQSDDLVLKSMVRSNPGLLLLVDGVVRGIWGVNELPENLLNKPINESDIVSVKQSSFESITKLVGLYLIPLLLVIFLDGIMLGRKYYLHWKYMNKVLEIRK